MLDASTILHLLANDTRRRLLLALCDEPTLHVPDDLSVRGGTQTAQSQTLQSRPLNAREEEEPPPRSEIELYHNHLPRLAESGVIEWHESTDLVSRGPNFEAVEPVVRLLAEHAGCLPGEFF